MVTSGFPPQINYILKGWELVWFQMKIGSKLSWKQESAFAQLWEDTHVKIRDQFKSKKYTDIPVVQLVRKLFKESGCDPSRYRPSSEALIRRIVKGNDLPHIHPLVDINNLLSISLVVPCCIIDADKVGQPLTFRKGEQGEKMLSMRGSFNLENKPLIEDSKGPFGTPITDSERVKITNDSKNAWLVIYFPEGYVDRDKSEFILSESEKHCQDWKLNSNRYP
jgi:DNA/RNA-binding domain of Phe-tRNA-synthetase-like protein